MDNLDKINCQNCLYAIQDDEDKTICWCARFPKRVTVKLKHWCGEFVNKINWNYKK